MPKLQLKSIIAQIAESVFKMNNLNEAKKYVTEFIASKDINETDKKIMLNEVNNTKSIYSFHRYLSNCLLKYEGLGVNQINKSSRSAARETEFE